jgi:hypothetical protein
MILLTRRAFDAAQARYTSVQPTDYQQYTDEQADLYEDVVDMYDEVRLVPLAHDGFDEFESWAVASGIDDFDTREARVRYAMCLAEDVEPWEGTYQDALTVAEAAEELELVLEPDGDPGAVLDVLSELYDELTDLMLLAPAAKITAVAPRLDGPVLVTQVATKLTGTQLLVPAGELEALNAVLLVAVATSGSVTVRTSSGTLADNPGPTDQVEVRAYHLADGACYQLDEAELFAAYCTDALTGEPLPPEHGVIYVGADS